jgi:hypothetical protein
MFAASMLAASLALCAEPAFDPCSESEVPVARDPALAAVYRNVGESELERGNQEAAAIAFRKAADLDPEDRRAANWLASLCGMGTVASTAAVERSADVESIAAAVDLVDRGRCADALARIEGQGARERPEAALIRGICHLDDPSDSARSDLLTAAKDPALAETANLLLAALAYREGQSDDARAFLSPITGASPGTARAASDLERLIAGGSTSRLVAAASVDAVADSNPGLASDQDRAAPPQGAITGSDAAVRTAAAIHYAPFRLFGPYVDGAASYQKQVTNGALDLAAFDAAAGFRVGREDLGLSFEYAFDYELEGGTAYLAAHNVGARGQLYLQPLRITGSYLLRFESFLTDAAKGTSGTLQAATLDAGMDVTVWMWVRAGYHVADDKTDDTAFKYFEHGPRVQLSFRPISPLRIGLDGILSFRAYDTASAPSGGVARSDTELDGLVTGEYYLGSSFSLVLSGIVRRTTSTDTEQTYTRLIAVFGVRWARGFY